MPYPGLDAEQSAKVDSCVEQVMASGKPKENAIPICIASVTGKSGKEISEMLGRGEKEIADLVTSESVARKESWRVGAARDLPVQERGAAWNADAAKSRIFTWAGWPDDPNPSKARRAFLLYDAENDENQGAYKDPIADVVDGQLKVVSAALGPAASRLPQTDAPSDVLDRARGVLDGYYDKLRGEREEKEATLIERFMDAFAGFVDRISEKGAAHPWHTGIPGQRGGSASSGGGGAAGGGDGEGNGGGDGGGGARGAAIESVYRQSDRLSKMSPKKREAMVSELAKESLGDLKKMGGWALEMETSATDRSTKRNMRVMRDMLMSAIDRQSGKEQKQAQDESPPTEEDIRKMMLLFERIIIKVEGEGEKEGRRHSTKDEGMLQTIHDNAVELGASCPMVMKQADGRWRWVMLSSNAYEDTDGEIVSLKALADDVERADRTGDYGVLDWWHMPTLKLGVCDFNAMQGNVLVESGTFHNDDVGAIMSKRLKKLQGSLTFYHPASEPDRDGVFHHIRRAARALLPRGKAANLLTAVPAVTRKGSQMPTLKEKWTEFVGLLDGKEDLAKQVVSDADAVEKQAEDMRLRHKEPQRTDVAPASAAPAESQAPDMAAQFQAAMQPILDEIKSLKEQMGAQTSKAAGEDGKRASQVAELQKQIKEQRDSLANMEAALKELMGEQPRGKTAGFRPSQDAGTILHGADKEAFAVQPNPLDNFLKDMGMLQPGG